MVVASHKRHKKHEYTLDTIPEDMPKEQVDKYLHDWKRAVKRAKEWASE